MNIKISKLFVFISLLLIPVMLAGCGGGGGGGSAWFDTTVILKSVEVEPAQPSIALGKNVQLTATGIYSDGTRKDLSSVVAWSSSAPGIATVSVSGLAISESVGKTTIRAVSENLVGSATITVTERILESIDITPALPSIALGTVQQFTAIGTYSDDTIADITTAVTWASSNTGVATASGSTATAVATGVTTITATLGSVSGSTDLTVASLDSIYIEPDNATIPKGLMQQFVAVGLLSDGSEQDLTAYATWVSSEPLYATVNDTSPDKGQVNTLAAGSTTITASYSGKFASTPLTVTDATLQTIAITPASPGIAVDTALQFTAIGTYSDSSTFDLTSLVDWTSSNNAVATISNTGFTKGVATSVGNGITTIKASITDSYAGDIEDDTTLTVTSAKLTSITVQPTNATISLGTTQQYTAQGNFSDGSAQDLTDQVIWRSSNKINAVISNAAGSKGLLTPLRAGGTTVSATFASGSYFILPVTGTTGLTINSGTLTGIRIDPPTPSVNKGKTLQLRAFATYNAADGSGTFEQELTKSVNLTWSSADKLIATVVNVPKKDKGLVKGVATGTVTITAKVRKVSEAGSYGTAVLTVN
ncbi:MAG: hypothetical protein CVU66_00945 [Deltaproteobacteria bacterium HGW-Deltaproteobacteria-23]|nr:MAG: hypothetical protein CVU66_00945 [Deltaproteobacteria bacterium HGW-Deltaproteobacteria-23]